MKKKKTFYLYLSPSYVSCYIPPLKTAIQTVTHLKQGLLGCAFTSIWKGLFSFKI